MKIRNFKYIFILSLGLILSCQKYLDVNQDPNRSLTATPQLLLPVAQTYIGNGLGDRMASQMNVWCQYWTTGPGTSLNIWDKNNMNTSDGNQIFSQFYQRSMSALYTIITKHNDQPVFQGIAKILMAYQMQISVDLFGNVPYSEAFRGTQEDGQITSPKYDDAATIYSELVTLLDEGIALINATYTDVNVKYPSGANDLIFKGNLDQWLNFANSVKLKLYMRQYDKADAAKQAEIKLAVEALEADAALILSNDDIAKIRYGSDAPNYNPMWNDFKSSIGLTNVASKTSIDLLATNPYELRIDAFYDKNAIGVHNGLKQGDVNNAPPTASYSKPNGADAANGGIIFGKAVPVILISPWEVKFLLSEAAAKGFSLTSTDEDYYKLAITDNFEYFGFSTSEADDYLNSTPAMFDNSSLNGKIRSIAIQKWVAFNGTQPVESWIETRRLDNTANPIFASPGGIFQVPTENDLGGSIFPSILFYPAIEENYNTNFPTQHTLTDKVFWDN
jgi:hypothetical protein